MYGYQPGNLPKCFDWYVDIPFLLHWLLSHRLHGSSAADSSIDLVDEHLSHGDCEDDEDPFPNCGEIERREHISGSNSLYNARRYAYVGDGRSYSTSQRLSN